MAHAEICPVCGGAGKITAVNDNTSTTAPYPEICNGCGGCGWITVRDDCAWPDKSIPIPEPYDPRPFPKEPNKYYGYYPEITVRF